MDISELERLVDLVQNAQIGEITLRQGSQRVTIRKSPLASSASTFMESDDASFDLSGLQTEDIETLAASTEPSTVMVTAPLVGVFGHVKPLIGLNARLTEGQVIGIIEAMKIVTEIKAPAAGRISDVFIEDGHPVEFGQALFEITPN